MSIATEISRLQSAKASIKTAIEGKGVTVPSATLLDGYAALITSIPTGGGSSPLVTGTFTASTTGGAAQAVTIPYTGSGYPVAAIICTKGGLSSTTNPTWGSLVQRYAIGFVAIYKNAQTTAPTYGTSGSQNSGSIMTTYKSSATSATTYTRGGDTGANTFSSGDAGGSVANCVKFKSATSMSVYIASTSYGLVAGMDYDYFIVYSS